MSTTESRERTPRARRRADIRAVLASQPMVRIGALAARFQVSAETIRRDIDAMAAEGLLARTYGGAAALHTAREPSLGQRSELNGDARRRMAARAAARVHDGEVLMMDASATCLHLAHRLVVERRRLTIITNSATMAQSLAANPGFEILLAPGRFDARENAGYGALCTAFVARFNADHCFSSCGALTADGPTEVGSDLAAVKRMMIERAQRTTLLVDQAKFGPGKLECVCALTAIDTVICDQAPPASLAEALHGAGVALHIAD